MLVGPLIGSTLVGPVGPIGGAIDVRRSMSPPVVRPPNEESQGGGHAVYFGLGGRLQPTRVRSASQLGLGRSVRVRSARGGRPGGRLAPPSIYRGPS